MLALLETPEKIDAECHLTIQDRCDKCGARAYVSANSGSTPLMFCAHHGRLAIPGLLAAGFHVLDFTSVLWDEEAQRSNRKAYDEDAVDDSVKV